MDFRYEYNDRILSGKLHKGITTGIGTNKGIDQEKNEMRRVSTEAYTQIHSVSRL
jgi:hypothetical protein